MLLRALIPFALVVAAFAVYTFADTVAFDTGSRTNHPRAALRFRGLEPFRLEHARAVEEGHAERAWGRALAAVDFGDVQDGEGRTLFSVVDDEARVVALITPDEWGVWPSFEWWPNPRPGWSAPILLITEDGWAELVGSDDYAVGRAVRAAGDDLAWTRDDPRIEWLPLETQSW